jgi:hypothetical protein
LLQGYLGRCVTGDGEYILPSNVLPAGQTLTKAWCESNPNITTSAYLAANNLTLPVPYNLGTRWVTPLQNFDNVINSISTLFQASTTEMWILIMYDGIDATKPGQQPLRNSHPAMAIFFVVFMVVMTFFMLNLFVGVAIDKVSALLILVIWNCPSAGRETC